MSWLISFAIISKEQVLSLPFGSAPHIEPRSIPPDLVGEYIHTKLYGITVVIVICLQ